MATLNTNGAAGFRFHQIVSDGMEPTARKGDYVLAIPAHQYVGEGYYLVSNALGGTDVFSCSGDGTRDAPMIRLHRHNKHYSDQLVRLERFNEMVLAQVAMFCNVVRPDLLAHARRLHVMEA